MLRILAAGIGPVTLRIVMAGLDPAIPLRDARCLPKRDARHKAGHDADRQ